MPNVNFDNLRILATLADNIVLTYKPKKMNGTENMMYCDLSKDITNEVMTAVLQFLKYKSIDLDDDTVLTYTIEGLGTITFEKEEKS